MGRKTAQMPVPAKSGGSAWKWLSLIALVIFGVLTIKHPDAAAWVVGALWDGIGNVASGVAEFIGYMK